MVHLWGERVVDRVQRAAINGEEINKEAFEETPKRGGVRQLGGGTARMGKYY